MTPNSSTTSETPHLTPEQTRARILGAASQVFAEKGFHRASTREICRLAGVNNAAINYHFGNKGQLYSEVLRQPLRRMTEAALINSSAQADLRTHLHAFIRSILLPLSAENEDAARHYRIIAREIIEPTGLLCDSMRADVARYFHILRTRIAQELPKEYPEAELDRLCLAIAGQAVFFARSKPTIADLSPCLKLDAAGVAQLSERLTDYAIILVTTEARTSGRTI